MNGCRSIGALRLALRLWAGALSFVALGGCAATPDPAVAVRLTWVRRRFVTVVFAFSAVHPKPPVQSTVRNRRPTLLAAKTLAVSLWVIFVTPSPEPSTSTNGSNVSEVPPRS